MNKPCPFCGCQQIKFQNNHSKECYFHVKDLLSVFQPELDKAWNKRISTSILTCHHPILIILLTIIITLLLLIFFY